MIYKYIVPKHERKRYVGKKVIYCEVIDKILLANEYKDYVYKVKILNNNNRISVFNSNEVKKLNVIDKIKVFFIKER